MTKDKGVLLVNMGGPVHELDMKFFLLNMFHDKHILPFNPVSRTILARMITTFRYKKSWKKYQLIGGTPLIEATCKTTAELSKLLPNYDVRLAFSYSAPLIHEVMQKMHNAGIKQLVVVPLYPHFSLTTFESVVADSKNAAARFSDFNLQFVAPYYANPHYIDFWKDIINKHIKQKKLQNPLLLFSAHSIPAYFVEKQNDPYPQHITESAQLIARACGLEHKVSYQSQVKGSKWIGPTTPDTVLELKKQGLKELVYVPISFVSENLETLYDLDHDLVPFAQKVAKIENASRVRIPDVHESFVNALFEAVKQTE